MHITIDNPFIVSEVNHEIVPGIILQYPRNTLVEDIKARVAELTGISSEHFDLYEGDKKLDPQQKLRNVGSLLQFFSSLRFTNEERVLLRMVENIQPRTDMFQLFVKTLSGGTITVDANENDTVVLLKYIIFTKEGIPPHQQRIIYGGRQLENDKKLKEYKLGREHTIHLVIRLGGCGGARVSVTLPNGDEVIYTSPCCAHVTTVKAFVENEKGIPKSQQRLFFGDKEVEDGQKLAKYTDLREINLRLVLVPCA